MCLFTIAPKLTESSTAIALAQLQAGGMNPADVLRLAGLLKDLDVADDPWVVRDVLRDVLRFMSPALLGRDLQSFAGILSNNSPPSPETLFARSVYSAPRHWFVLRRAQHRAILSSAPYAHIARRVARTSNRLVRDFLTTTISDIWSSEGVPANSPGVVYFREMKTFASDLDVYYWGPRAERVRVKLTQASLPLGLKVDNYSYGLLTRCFDASPETALFTLYPRIFFMMGNWIELNGATREAVYNHDVLRPSDSDSWQALRPTLAFALRAADPVEVYSSPKSRLLRPLQFLIYGLAIKFQVPLRLNWDSTLRSLRKHAGDADIATLERGLALAGQLRNVLQVVSGTRSEPFGGESLARVRTVLATQGVPDLFAEIQELLNQLEGLMCRHLDIPSDTSATQSLRLNDDQFFSAVWERTAEIYAQVRSLNKLGSRGASTRGP